MRFKRWVRPPHDRQISDHKRKIILQVGKAMKNAQGWESSKTDPLITTKRKIGYVLNLKSASDSGDPLATELEFNQLYFPRDQILFSISMWIW